MRSSAGASCATIRRRCARWSVAESGAAADVIITTGGTGITARDSTYEAHRGASRQATRRIRRAFPDAELRRDRRRRDAEPRDRGLDRLDGHLLAAGIGACRAAGDDQTDPPRGRPRRAGAETMTDRCRSRSARPFHSTRRARSSSTRRSRSNGPSASRSARRTAACSRDAAISTVDVPPFDRAAMDGYAVIAEDTFGASSFEPKTLRCIETVFTGQVARERVSRGTCIEIATGAPTARGRRRGGDGRGNREGRRERRPRAHAGLSAAARRAPRRRHHGRPDALLAPATCSTRAGSAPSRRWASSTSRSSRRPRVAILSTGNEIVEPGQPLGPGQLYDINQFTLASIIGAHGGVAVVHPTVADSLPALTRSGRRRGRRRHAGLLGRQLGRRARSRSST